MPTPTPADVYLGALVAEYVWYVLGFFFAMGLFANATDPVAKRMRERSE